jgi:thiol-disulfide isomerase/thioredoxin
MDNKLIIGIVICLILVAGVLYLFRNKIFAKKQPANLINQLKQVSESKQNKPQVEKYSAIQSNISVILCYANWCGHCPAVKEWFVDLVNSSPLEKVTFTMIEESNIPADILNVLDGFPTILIVSNGSYDKYPGQRNKSDLLTYLENI